MTVPFNTEGFAKANARLPFSIDKISFIGWMGDLDLENKVETLRYLFSTLKILKQELIKPEDRLFFLQKLSELVEQLSRQLQETYKNSCFPFSEQNNKKLELSVSCATEIAKNYALLCEDEYFKTKGVFTPQQKALIIYSAIQAQANVLLYQSLLYQKPEKGFWRQCFLFYLFAEKNNVLDFEIESDKTCFISVFKQILLFELSNVRQFNAEELLAVFQLLKKFSDKVELLSKVPDKKIRDFPCINLQVDAPPTLLKEGAEQEPSHLFYIYSLHLIKQLLELSANKNTMEFGNKSMLLRLIKTLILNYQRKSEREIVTEQGGVSIGFDKVKAYLLKTEKTNYEKDNVGHAEIGDLDFEIQQIKSTRDHSGYFRSDRDANLTISTDFDVLKDIKSSDIWLSKTKLTEQESNKAVLNADILDKSRSGFRLKLNAVATKVGDIIGVTIFDTLVITVVRRIVQLQSNELQVGVEVLGNNPKIVHIGDVRNKNAVTALYLKGGDGLESLIIGTNDFHNEASIFTEKMAGFQVEKQFFMTSTIRHLKVRNEAEITRF